MGGFLLYWGSREPRVPPSVPLPNVPQDVSELPISKEATPWERIQSGLEISAGPIAAESPQVLPLAGDPKALWDTIMPLYFGTYNPLYGCWLSRDAAGTYCMTPHAIETRVTDRGRRFYLSVGGVSLDEAGDTLACHNCDPPSLGLLVLFENDTATTVVATNMTKGLIKGRDRLYERAGIFGHLPTAEAMVVHHIGPAMDFGWIVGYWDAYSGNATYGARLYGVVEGEVVLLLDVATGANNLASSECEVTSTACYSWEYAVSIDTSTTTNGFYGLRASPVGKWVGSASDPTPSQTPVTWHFDAVTRKFIQP